MATEPFEELFKTGRKPNAERALRTSRRMFDIPQGLDEAYIYLETIGYSGQLFPVFSQSEMTNRELLMQAEAVRPSGVQRAYASPFWDAQFEDQDYYESKSGISAGLAIFAKKPNLSPFIHEGRLLTSGGAEYILDEFNGWLSPGTVKLEMLSLRDFLTIVWMKRLENVRPKSRRFPFNNGELLTPYVDNDAPVYQDGIHHFGNSHHPIYHDNNYSIEVGVVSCDEGAIRLSSRPAAVNPYDPEIGVGFVIKVNWEE